MSDTCETCVHRSQWAKRGAAGTASAAHGACVQAGFGTFKSPGLVQADAQTKIDSSVLAKVEAGPISAKAPSRSFLSLGQVVKPHTSDPTLFAWVR